MIKRILVIASCVALLVCCFSLPASAAVLDYNNYIHDISVNGENDHITLSFSDLGMWLFNDDIFRNRFTGNLSSSPAFPRYYPTMNLNGSVDSLPRSDFPDDTVFTFSFSCLSQNVPSSAYLNIRQFAKDGSYVYNDFSESSVSVSADVVPNYSIITITIRSINFHPDCETFYFDLEFNTPGIPSSVGGSEEVTYWYDFQNPQFFMNFSINSLLRQQQLSNKQNAILNAVEQQLADQGKTLDDVLGAQQDTNDKLDGIINDKVDPSLPSGNDIVGDLDDAEGQIRDDAQSGLDQGASVQQSAIQVLGQYLSAFACVSWIFDRFSTIPFVSGLLALSFSLGITGAILGIGLSIARSYSGSSRSSRSSRS